MLGLLSLPYEVLSNIVAHISFDDVFNLGQTCQDFQFLLMEESIAKIVVQVRLPSHSPTFEEQDHYFILDLKFQRLTTLSE